MKRIILAALLCSAALPAQADPITTFIGFIAGGAGAAGFGAITSIFGVAAGTVGFTFLTTGLRLLGSLALSAISARLNRPKMPAPADRMRNFSQPMAPMQRIYGRVRVGGAIGFTGFATDVVQLKPGSGGAPAFLDATSTATRYNAVLVAAHRTKGLVQHFLDSRPTEVDAIGEIITEPMVGYGALRCYTGQPGQAVDPVLNAVFAEITTAHDFAGLSYVVLEARRAGGNDFPTIYSTGNEWMATPVWDGHDAVFDPRDDTYKHTSNAALIIAHEAVMFGKAVDWDEVAAEADICDQLVTNGKGVTQRRWTINVVLDDTMSWETVRDTLGMACDAWYFQRADGKMGFKVGRWIEPTLTLTDRDFLALQLGDKAWGPDLPGEFVVTYVEPSRDYREAPTGAYVVQPGGARQSEECFAIDNHNQAARVAKLLSRAMLPRFSVSGSLKLIGFECIGHRFVRITSAAHGKTLVIEVTKLEMNADGISFALEGRSATEEDYAFVAAVEEPARPVNEPVVNDDAIVEVGGLSGAIVAGTGGVAQIEWSWEVPDDPSLTQDLRVRSLDGGVPDWQLVAIAAGQSSFVASGLVDGATYEGQARNRTGSGKVSDWSDSVAVLAVANSSPPPALTGFGVTAAGSTATVAFTAPDSAAYYATRVFRGPSTSFGDAALVRVEYGLRAAADSWADTGLVAGTYRYWVEPINASGIAGSRSGPETITIT